MHPSNPIMSNSQSVKSPSVANESPADRLDGVFDVATTIQRLCTEGLKGLGSADSLEPKDFDENGLSKKAVPAFDVLSTAFLQTVAGYLASVSGLSMGLLITTKSGAVIQAAHCGWDASVFRVQGSVLAKVAKESVWRMEPLFSNDALASRVDFESGSSTVQISACLNELSSILKAPICAIPFALNKSSGYGVMLCDATPIIEHGIAKFCSRASQLWLGKESLESLVRQLDTWLIIRRCSGFTKVWSWFEWVRARPRWWLTPIGLACAAVFAPIPYYPCRDCVFEPETKQYLSSPIQGRIASCEVRPGDHVEKGQLMARIDDDQLRRDLATANAEFDGALKKRDSALASRATGNVGLADVEMNQARWRIESIEDQLRRLEIRATTSGIVVQGDWQRNVGMPLTLGQSLFEVAELESMTAEVRLLAADLAQIDVGDEVSIRSDASGIETFRGKISRIEPRATVIDDAAVFVADVVIHDPKLQLRPGMKASAQIHAGWRTLGWYLFNRPYRWIANQWIW